MTSFFFVIAARLPANQGGQIQIHSDQIYYFGFQADGKGEVRQMTPMALSYDHRVIDGADAERFLAYVKEQLEAGEFSL